MKANNKKPVIKKTKPSTKTAVKSSVNKQRLASKPKYNLDLSINSRGLTIEKWQELARKEPSLLTATEEQQLTETNKMAAELAKHLSELYDFADLFRAIQSAPVLKIIDDIGRAVNVTQVLSNNLGMPVQQFVNFQQSLSITSSVINKVIIDAANMASITRSLFAGFGSYHTQIIKSLSVNIASLGSIARISAIETIDFAVQDVREQDGFIVTSGNTSQMHQIDDYVFVRKASLDLIFTELQVTRSEVVEVKQLIKSGLKNGVTKIVYADAKFRREASKLILRTFEIIIQPNSKQAQFCELFFKSKANFSKKWDIEDFVEEAFGMHIGSDGSEAQMTNLIKGYVNALNQKIAVASKGQLVNFFVLVKLEVYISPEYVSDL